ncbi:MAG: acyl--CoA ligase [Blautia sp.]|nr:acyl--CoA ligase [Blautia sp.]
MQEAYHTIKELLSASAVKYSDREVVRYKAGKDAIEAKTYLELKNDSESFSRALEKLGVLGEHIALTGRSSYAWLCAYFGIVNSGSVAVPLDVSLPAEELAELIDRSHAKALVIDGLRADVIAIAKERCRDLQYLITMQGQTDGGLLSLGGLIAENAGVFEAEPGPDTLCTIMYTSGTTGKSKGVMLTHRNLADNATCLDLKLPEHSTLLSVLPIHHAYCLSMDILKGISLGSTICINDSLLHMAKNIKLFEPDMILMVPLMIESFAKKLQDAPEAPAEYIRKEVFGGRLHTICSGGAYLNPDYLDLFGKFGITILQGYGMTECAPVISTNPPWNIKNGSVGQLLPNCEAKTVDGELCVRGSSVMLGYYEMPEETAGALKDGWLHTGDLGYVDGEGYVYLTGRKKNLIITKNGENVSPEELENKLGESRLVQEILVREKEGLIEAEIYPDLEYVKTHGVEDIRAGLQKLVDDYNSSAQSFKKVYSLIVRDTEFPKTASGKVRRF